MAEERLNYFNTDGINNTNNNKPDIKLFNIRDFVNAGVLFSPLEQVVLMRKANPKGFGEKVKKQIPILPQNIQTAVTPAPIIQPQVTSDPTTSITPTIVDSASSVTDSITPPAGSVSQETFMTDQELEAMLMQSVEDMPENFVVDTLSQLADDPVVAEINNLGLADQLQSDFDAKINVMV